MAPGRSRREAEDGVSVKFHWFAEVTYDGLPGAPVELRERFHEARELVLRSNSIETWELVTRENYCYGHLSFSGLRAAKPLVDGYWDYVAAPDGDLNPHRMAFTQLICVADSDAEAERRYYEAVRTRVIPQLRDLWADEPDHWPPEVSRQLPPTSVGARASASTLVGGS